MHAALRVVLALAIALECNRVYWSTTVSSVSVAGGGDSRIDHNGAVFFLSARTGVAEQQQQQPQRDPEEEEEKGSRNDDGNAEETEAGDDDSNRSSSSGNIVELSVRHREPRSAAWHRDLSVAVCFKTLFGEIDLGVVLQWAAYHRLLGFDHIFLYYRPEITMLPQYEELHRLPYVTLTLRIEGNTTNYFKQWKTERECLSSRRFAAKYDWAMLADVDEYLYFYEPMGIKEYLIRHHSNDTYVSFGKRMFTLDHSPYLAAVNAKIDTQPIATATSNSMATIDDGDGIGANPIGNQLAVSQYPFYMEGNFCYAKKKRRRGRKICPTWKGRSKVIVRPAHHTRIDVHGNVDLPDLGSGRVHVDPDAQAHFMEWPGIFAVHNVTRHQPPLDFVIRNESEVHIHNLAMAYQPSNSNNSTGSSNSTSNDNSNANEDAEEDNNNENGENGDDNEFELDKDATYQMKYADYLPEWFAFVRSRASTSSTG
jgi:Glycosyltransferase family 92